MGKDKTWLVVKEEPLAGYSLPNIVKVLWDNKFEVDLKYFHRFLYAIGLSVITSPLKVIQKLRFHRKIKKTEIKEDPIFIIGHYRTGTTYLMTLMAYDKSKGYVSNTEAYATLMYLGFPKLTKWIIEASLPDVRPMDNVIMGAEEPTEEEYCLGTFSKYGYYTGFIFPKNFDLYTKYLTFEGMPRHRKRWKKQFYYLVQMLTLGHKGKQLFLKNPVNSYRIKGILEMFPKAKFIHTYRDPYKVYSSTVKFFDEVFGIYTLQKWDEEKMKQDILDNYKLLYEYQDKDLHLIPEDRIFHMKYEEFIKNPSEKMAEMYKHLKIDGWDEYKDDIIAYAESQRRDYVPNVHKTDDEVIRRVNGNWNEYRKKYGYEKLLPSN
ncbi:MAG: sulfotransferase [Candidatus Heimdallarchaeota archaeon]|nr:sulfotransferase [Candidatus Heimdallarchaeota archaeon]MCG3258012.1 sulfotransferase [Candidatus Heimdallarchaeota archaeon]MCK4613061.1 sulfotransferase [Candidatus Heimdallarchaeota archaeon]